VALRLADKPRFVQSEPLDLSGEHRAIDFHHFQLVVR
jgi:hypothetical protein